MAERSTGSFAREIDPDGCIKADSVRAPFNQHSNDNRDTTDPGRASEQVARTGMNPREPAPREDFNKAKAAEHRQAMRSDDQNVKDIHRERAKKLIANRAMRGPSLTPDRSRGRERGDD